jgi:hypothetical protein
MVNMSCSLFANIDSGASTIYTSGGAGVVLGVLIAEKFHVDLYLRVHNQVL